MTPVIDCSIGSAILVPKATFILRKGNQSTRCGISEKYPKLKSSRRLLLPQSSLRLLRLYDSQYSSGLRTGAAFGTYITVEEPNPAVSGEAADENSEMPSGHVESSTSAPGNTATTGSPTSKHPRSVRKSEMPAVKDEEVVPGAWFMGKVRSILPFGCFVDFGAFTDGLVHVSRMSDTYVKDVASFVSIGQEVKVRVVEANQETGRISLALRENDDNSKTLPKQESPKGESSEKPRFARNSAPGSNQKREGAQKSSKFVKGKVLDGTVKNVTRSGAYVSLPDGEEGFLPVAEESEGFGCILGSSSLEVGQEVNVRVLRFSRGKATLTMKKEADVEGLNKKLNKGVVHVAINPFELAFRENKEIAAFLDGRDRTGKSSEKLQQEAGKTYETVPAESSLSQDAESKDSVVEELPKEDTEHIIAAHDSLEDVVAEAMLTHESKEATSDSIGIHVTEGASSSEFPTMEAPVNSATSETILLHAASSKPLELEEVESLFNLQTVRTNQEVIFQLKLLSQLEIQLT